MRPSILVLPVFALLVALSACGDDGETADDRDAWCSTLNEYAIALEEVTGDATRPVDQNSAEALALGELIASFARMDVPDPIDDDWDQALPRGDEGMEELHRPERVAAQVRSFTWVVENCELDADVEAGFRRSIESGREELGDEDAPSTTA